MHFCLYFSEYIIYYAVMSLILLMQFASSVTANDTVLLWPNRSCNHNRQIYRAAIHFLADKVKNQFQPSQLTPLSSWFHHEACWFISILLTFIPSINTSNAGSSFLIRYSLERQNNIFGD